MDDHPVSRGTTLVVGLDDRLVGCRGCCCSRIRGLAGALRLRRSSIAQIEHVIRRGWPVIVVIGFQQIGKRRAQKLLLGL
jgi:hypothetical protein